MNELARRRASLGALVALFAILSLAMVIGGYTFYRRQAQSIQAQRYRELRTIAALKIMQIVAWRNERLRDVGLNASRIGMRARVAKWMASSADASLKGIIDQDLTQIRDIRGYQNVILLGTDGRILLSLDSRATSSEAAIKALSERAIREGHPVLGDFFRCANCDQVHLDAAAPILGPGGKPIALLLLRSDPEAQLYPLIQSWPTPSDTAETLLVRREGENVLFLNRLRHNADPTLTFTQPVSRRDLPAAQAVMGKTGEFFGHDYRGIQVLADLQPVPGSPWFMVAKVDAREILAEARYRGGVILGFMGVGILMLGTLLGFLFYFGQAKLYQELFHATRFESDTGSEVESARIQRSRSLARIAGFASAAVGCLVLAGWTFDVTVLKNVLPGLVTMKANTAIGLLLAGAALSLQTWPRGFRQTARICAGALVLVGVLTLAQYLFGWDLQIDQLLFREPAGMIGTLSPGRMAPATALNFALFGGALILASFRRTVAASQWLALPTGLIGLLSLLGYLYGPFGLYGIGYYLQLALHTAVTFILLSLGLLLLTPEDGFMKRFMAESIGGWLLRRMVLFIPGVSVLIGWMRALGERRGWYENAVGVALIVTTFVILMLVATWWAARSLDRIDSIRSQAEARVREGAEEIRATLYGIGDGVIAADAGGRVVHMNPVAERLTGWKEVEAFGRSLEEVFRIISEETQEQVENPVERVLREGKIVGLANHTLLIAKDGTRRAIADSGAPVLDGQGDIARVVLVFRDQTAERAAQLKLMQSETRYRRLHESMRDAYSQVDMEGRILEHNRLYEEMLGYSEEELRHLTYADLTPPAWHAMEARIIREEVLPLGYSRVYEKTCRRKDGTEFPVELRTNLLTGDHGEPIGMWAIVRDITGRKIAEEQIKAAQAETLRLLQVADQSRKALLSVVEDQKAAEEEIRELNADLEERVLIRTTELESANKELEAFAYSVSHDLRAPLRHMDGFLSMLGRHLGHSLDGKGAHYLDVAQRASVRMGLLVDGLLSFSRLGRTELRVTRIDAAGVVFSVIEEFRNEWADRVVHWNVGRLPVLHGDPTLVRLVFQNLLGNALKFTRNGHETVIEIQPIEGLVEETGIVIRDNGAGFDPAYTHKLFSVFQRLHREEEFEGTGIGLANVHRIVSRHGGRVWAEGRLGEGAAFFVTFPVTEGQA